MKKKNGFFSSLFTFSALFLYKRKTTFRKEQGPINQIKTNDRCVVLSFNLDLSPKMKGMMQHGRVKNWYDEKILAILEFYKIPAVFFVSGAWALMHPKELKQIANNPLFEIGNHGFSHRGFSMLSFDVESASTNPLFDEQQIIETEKILEKYPNYKKFFRFPSYYNCWENMYKVQQLRYIVIGGDIEKTDLVKKGSRRIAGYVLRKMKPGSIIILHAHNPNQSHHTSVALLRIIEGARKKKYHFVKLSELLK